MGTFIDGKPIVCGGFYGQSSYESDCYYYDFEVNFWLPLGTNLPTVRAFAASVMLNATHWWITG